MEFQAKDIQQILGIPKIRYEHLARRIRIIPEIEEVEGTGRARRFSIKNLLEFAAAERCSVAGFTMRKTKWMVDLLRKRAPGFFAPPRKPSGRMVGMDVYGPEVYVSGIPGGAICRWILDGKKENILYTEITEKEIERNPNSYYAVLAELAQNPERLKIPADRVTYDDDGNEVAYEDEDESFHESAESYLYVNFGWIRYGTIEAAKRYLNSRG
jgi:hypothetical protein